MGQMIGRPAPAFRLQDQDSVWVGLQDLLAEGAVVLAFYPADLSYVCTRQLCDYRDASDALLEHGVRVVGISPDPPARHRQFLAAKGLGFRLLSDPDMTVFRLYHVFSRWLPVKSRGLFVIARDGRVVYERVEPTAFTHRTAAEVLGVLEELRGQL
jgi:peroxiredoxin Q/BCP